MGPGGNARAGCGCCLSRGQGPVSPSACPFWKLAGCCRWGWAEHWVFSLGNKPAGQALWAVPQATSSTQQFQLMVAQSQARTTNQGSNSCCTNSGASLRQVLYSFFLCETSIPIDPHPGVWRRLDQRGQVSCSWYWMSRCPQDGSFPRALPRLRRGVVGYHLGVDPQGSIMPLHPRSRTPESTFTVCSLS